MKTELKYFFIPFFFCSLLFTPLGLFNDQIDPLEHSSFFSLTTIDAGDDQGYYAYIRSLVFDGDIDFYNENNYAYNLLFTQTHYTLNLWPTGASILWAPFFGFAYVLEGFGRSLGWAGNSMGYGRCYLIATGLGTAFYVFCGLILLYRTLLRWFSSRAACFAVWAVFLSSPLVYFTFIRSRMAHFAEFFSMSLFLYLWFQRSPENKPAIWSFALGVSLGLVTVARYTNGAVVLIPLIYLFQHVRHSNFANPHEIRSLIRSCIWVFLGFSSIFSFQISVWHILFDSFYPNDPHLVKFSELIIPESFGIFWKRLIDVTAGPYFGLIYCFPSWIIGFTGLFVLKLNEGSIGSIPGLSKKVDETRAIKSVFILLAFIPLYLTLTWTLAENSSYGRRLLVGSLPFITFGSAFLFDRFNRGRWFLLLASISFLSITLNLLHMVQFRWLVDFFEPEYSWQVFKNIFLMFKQPEGILSTSLLKVLISGDFSLESPVDSFFILGIPLVMGGLMVIGLSTIGSLSFSRFNLRFFQLRSFFFYSMVGICVGGSFYLLENSPRVSEEDITKRNRFAALMSPFPEFFYYNTFSGGESNLLEAVNLNPKSPRALLQLGYFYFKKGLLERGSKLYQKSLSLDPHNHNALWALGTIFKQSSDNRYKIYWRDALKLQPHSFYRQEIIFDSALEEFRYKKYMSSYELAKKVIRLNPSFKPSYKLIETVEKLINR